MKDRGAAMRFDLEDTTGAACGMPSHERHPGAKACQGSGHRPAENTGAANDDGRLAFEVENVAIHASI